MSRIKKGNKGFTLIELIVTLAVITILGTGLVMLLEPAYRTARQSSFLSEDRLIAQSIMQQLKREVAAAGKGSVTVENGGEGITFRSQSYGTLNVSNSNGRVSVLCGMDEIGLEEGAYLGRTAAASFTKDDSANTVTVTVSMQHEGEDTYSLTETVRLLNE